MSGSNARGSNVTQGDTDVELVDTGALLAAYDLLSPRLRDLYDQCPEAFNSIEFLAAERRYGTEKTMGMILTALKRDYPDWSPILRRSKR